MLNEPTQKPDCPTLKRPSQTCFSKVKFSVRSFKTKIKAIRLPPPNHPMVIKMKQFLRKIYFNIWTTTSRVLVGTYIDYVL
jgi:hypothetical protein